MHACNIPCRAENQHVRQRLPARPSTARAVVEEVIGDKADTRRPVSRPEAPGADCDEARHADVQMQASLGQPDVGVGEQRARLEELLRTVIFGSLAAVAAQRAERATRAHLGKISRRNALSTEPPLGARRP